MRNLTDADRKRWLVRCGDQTVKQLMGWISTDGRVEVCEPDQTYPRHRLVWLWVYGRGPEPKDGSRRSEGALILARGDRHADRKRQQAPPTCCTTISSAPER